MDIQEEIIKSIELIVQKTVDRSNTSCDIPSVVKEISGNKYRVSVNGSDMWVKCGTNLTLSVGTTVWVHIPNGNIRKGFILAYR